MSEQHIKVLNNKQLEELLKCKSCERLLSSSPVYHSDFLGGGLCGHCCSSKSDECSNGVRDRQFIYESVAQYIIFPCSNRSLGCDKELKWDEVKTHESICNFKKLKCPFAYELIFDAATCIWTGNNKELNDHIQKAHREFILDPPQIDWPEEKNNNIYFTHVGNQIVTVILKYHKQSKYYCLIMVNDSDLQSQCYRYQLELLDENKVHSLILRKNRLESIDHFPENMNDLDKMLELEMNKIKEMLRRPKSILARFGIVKKNKKEISQITGIKEEPASSSVPLEEEIKLASPDLAMLSELECPVCNDYMIPPIYICQIGHSICHECKARVTICPSCQGHMSMARNFTLEKLTTLVNYPCKNRDLGCGFTTTSDKIREHEMQCELSDKTCFFYFCGWRGCGAEMVQHIREEHSLKLIEVDTVNIRDLKDGIVGSNYAVCLGNQIFRVFIKHSLRKGPLRFNVEQFGLKATDKHQYLYELQLIDTSPLGLNFTYTNVCKHFSNDSLEGAISISYDMFQPFIFDDQYIYFKVRIIRL